MWVEEWSRFELDLVQVYYETYTRTKPDELRLSHLLYSRLSRWIWEDLWRRQLLKDVKIVFDESLNDQQYYW